MRGRVLTSARSVAVLSVLTGLVGVGLLVLAFTRQAPGQPALAPERGGASQAAGHLAAEHLTAPSSSERGSTREREHRAGIADLVTGPVLRTSPPVRISIPRLQVTSALESLGLDDRGAMEVPHDPDLAGWYHLGPTPGALGPAVIAGHVTWDGVPAVFFELADLRKGDLVHVARSDDRVAVFRVTKIAAYKKSEFPTRSVFGPIDHAGLRLITCGGELDSSSHRYSDNVVVFARLVDTH